MHRLLERQVKRHLPPDVPAEKIAALLAAVEAAYAHADEARLLLEHSLNLAADELSERNKDLELEMAERKRATAQAERFGELTLDLLFVVDMVGRFLFVNPASVQALGGSREEVLRRRLFEFVSPEDRGALERALSAIAKGGSLSGHECRLVGPRGDARWHSLSARVPETGEPLLYCVARDITERKRAECDLRHAQKLQAVGQLAAGIAHEINTPIQFIGDSVGFLMEGLADLREILEEHRRAVEQFCAEDVKARLREMQEERDLEYLLEQLPEAGERTMTGIRRVAEIVQSMKEFAHPTLSEKAPGDIAKALTTTLVVARNEIKYVADVETDFQEVPLVLCYLGDLNQVFLNLLVNAAHAISDAVKGTDRRGLIRIALRRDGDFVLIDISDTGCGIPASIRDRVFEPFFTTKEVGRGTGQGLAIARSIVVEKHGGTLSFESEQDKGTTFTIRLPIGEPASRRRAIL